jgi:capsular polysaccharide biosynthesis protein
MVKQTYNSHMKTKNLIEQIIAFFSGDKNMAEVTKVVNYTDRMVAEMVAAYVQAPNPDTVAKLSEQLGKPTRSIVAKLVREGVYVAQQRVTKTGAPVIRKSDLVAQIQAAVGAELPTLEKASKADLQLLLDRVMGN